MPSLIRFLLVTGIISALIFGGLYVLAVRFEPPQKEISSPVYGLTLRRE